MREIQASQYGANACGNEEETSFAQIIARAFPSCKSFYIPRLDSKDAYLKIIDELDAEAKAQGAVPLSIIADYDTVDAILSGFDPDMTDDFDFCAQDNSKLSDDELPFSVNAQQQYLENVRQFYAGEAYDEEIPSADDLYEELCEDVNLDDVMGDFEAPQEESFVTSNSRDFALDYDEEFALDYKEEEEDDLAFLSSAPTVVVFFKAHEPHQVLGNTPIGGYGQMLDHIEICMVAQDWYEKYGIVPVSIADNGIEFKLDPSRLDEESAMELATKITAVLGFLPECYQTIGQFAYDLTQKQYFTIAFDVEDTGEDDEGNFIDEE